jgi:hypothetical protein
MTASNWLLRRHDQVGCAPFWPIDALEAQHTASFRVRPVEVRDGR